MIAAIVTQIVVRLKAKLESDEEDLPGRLGRFEIQIFQDFLARAMPRMTTRSVFSSGRVKV